MQNFELNITDCLKLKYGYDDKTLIIQSNLGLTFFNFIITGVTKELISRDQPEFTAIEYIGLKECSLAATSNSGVLEIWSYYLK